MPPWNAGIRAAWQPQRENVLDELAHRLIGAVRRRKVSDCSSTAWRFPGIRHFTSGISRSSRA